MQSCDLALFVTTVACSITKCVNKEELPTMAAVFTQLGDTLATIITQEEFLDSQRKNEKENGMGDN